jgi:hypothetical protein
MPNSVSCCPPVPVPPVSGMAFRFLHQRVALDLRGARLVYLRPGIVSLHLGEHLFHFAQGLTRFGNEISMGIAFKFGNQLTLPLNAKALVNDMLSSKFGGAFCGFCGAGRES